MTIKDLQEAFDGLSVKKMKLRDLKEIVKDAFKNSAEHMDLCQKIKDLQEKKKTIEVALKEPYAAELKQMDELEIDIMSGNELLADAALSLLMKGETVEVKDRYDNVYDPKFSVKFTKS